MSAFLDETGTLITVDHSNPLPVALVAGFTSLNDGELKTASYANPLPVTIVTTDYTEAELPDADDVAVGTEVFNTTYQVKMRSNGTSWEWLGIGKSTWVDKPAIAPLGQTICITDVGENGSLWRGNGTKWVRLNPIKIFSLSAPFSLTGTTSAVTLATATITIPAGLLGANGKLKIYPLWATTNNANVKTLRVVFGGSTCTTMTSQSVPNNSGLVIIRNTNSESAQKTSSGLVAGIGSSFGSIAVTTIDTTAATTITITGQLAVGGDTLTLEDLFVEVV